MERRIEMKELFTKKNIAIALVVLLLLVLVVVAAFRFRKEDSTVPDNGPGPIELPEEEFLNESSLSVDEVMELVNQKRADLKKLFYESYMYNVSEIDSVHYGEEDNANYTVFDEMFLQTLNTLVSDDIFHSFFEQMTLLKQDNNHSYYITSRTIFDDIYLSSAIAEVDITSEEIRFIRATDESINASVVMWACGEEEDCSNKTSFPFELTLIDNKWIISAFTK